MDPEFLSTIGLALETLANVKKTHIMITYVMKIYDNICKYEFNVAPQIFIAILPISKK